MTESLVVGVTGAAGYIGSRVVVDLMSAGHTVVPVDDFSVGSVERIRGRTVKRADVRDRDRLEELFDGVDAVCHLAAIAGVEACETRPRESFDVNVVGTANVAWLCREWGIPLVFPCSLAVIGEPAELPITRDHPRAPLNFYGRTKLMSEQDVRQLAVNEFPAHVYLISNVYGHHRVNGERIEKPVLINAFVERALAGDPLTVYEPGTQSRDFVHVKDVSRAYVQSVESLVDGSSGAETFTLGSGEGRRILDVAELIAAVAREERGLDVPVELVENPREGEATADEFVVDYSTARDLIGFEPTHGVEAEVRGLLA